MMLGRGSQSCVRTGDKAGQRCQQSGGEAHRIPLEHVSALNNEGTHYLPPLANSSKFEQDLPTSIRFQRLLESFFELLERIHMVHRGRERTISYEAAQLLVNLLDLCAGRVAYPIDEPKSVEAKTTVDEIFGRDGWELPTLHTVDDNRSASLERFGQIAHRSSA